MIITQRLYVEHPYVLTAMVTLGVLLMATGMSITAGASASLWLGLIISGMGGGFFGLFVGTVLRRIAALEEQTHGRSEALKRTGRD